MIFRTSSIEAGEREVSGVPSNFTSASRASSVSAEQLFKLLTQISPNCLYFPNEEFSKLIG